MENKIKFYWNKTSEQLKKFFSHVFWVALVITGIGIGFGEKQDIILAVDENQRLMVIDKSTGNYTIYDNEIGKTIFTLYARNIWGQHNPNQTPTPAK